METFREIERRFESLEAVQSDMLAGLKMMVAKQEVLQQETHGLRGAFASIEAMTIMNAAQMASYNKELADVKSRLDALERKAS